MIALLVHWMVNRGDNKLYKRTDSNSIRLLLIRISEFINRGKCNVFPSTVVYEGELLDHACKLFHLRYLLQLYPSVIE
ncbi:hypothetical protein HanPI659440_Chr03g0114041 [Helianthus annuus]|nr:hypothetical protein HanPI659440_Chr03g0114041 [Helianthus annuus]